MRSSSANTAFSGSVVSFPSANANLIVIEANHSWRSQVLKRLKEICDLKLGWDGYQAQPVSLANMIFALNMLESTCGNAIPAPQIVPGVNGDLQIEWHTLQGDVELHVIAPNRVRAWRSRVGPAQREDELELTIDFSAVAAWVSEITEQPRANDSAAA
jgi:hypothetical protein